MPLQSNLFRDDRKLQAASVSNPDHITPGAVGDHVGRIQYALRQIDGAVIDAAETMVKRYGASTANAVLAFKKKRDIINRSYQSQADNIVGIMTIAALDKEMLRVEQMPETNEMTTCKIRRHHRPHPLDPPDPEPV